MSINIFLLQFLNIFCPKFTLLINHIFIFLRMFDIKLASMEQSLQKYNSQQNKRYYRSAQNYLKIFINISN